jgi:pimeloyl-ACP methyl ester carboxylesterase
MFEGFERTEIATAGGAARIHLRHGGSGPSLLLLHGNPQTHVAWHRIAGRLAERFHVVAADLRGYGDSVGPDPTDTANYPFRVMAQDQVEVVRTLGHERFMVAGHDRGARTAHRMALDHPERVQRLALLDILQNRHVWQNASAEWALGSWHWLFMAQGNDLPEQMMQSVPPDWFMERKAAGLVHHGAQGRRTGSWSARSATRTSASRSSRPRRMPNMSAASRPRPSAPPAPTTAPRRRSTGRWTRRTGAAGSPARP